MADESWIFFNGKKIRVPRTPSEAPEFGWHLGAEYASALRWEEHDFESINKWCRETFDPHVYRMFLRSVWFINEQDATLCMLRWA